MTESSPPIDGDALAREALAGSGSIRLEFLLARLLPAAALRELARRHALTVKGFRIDRAPAERIATLLATGDAALVADACDRLVDAVLSAAAPGSSAVDPQTADPDELARARHEVDRLQRELDAGRAQSARFRQQVEELRRELETERESSARARSRIAQLERAASAQRPDLPPAAAEQASRIHDLERELEALAEAEANLRRRVALGETRLRDADAQIAELDALLPKGRRRKRPRPPEPEEERRLRIPHFTESFLKSLQGRDRLSIERSFRAVFTLCSEGPSYPGLEVKQIEGQDLWSMRAALKLRVYFRNREDGDIEVVQVADREDQKTTLRRLKER